MTRYLQRSEVVFAETRGDYVRLHTRSGQHLLRASLGSLEQRWAAAGFLRVHRQYLINRAYVEAVRTHRGTLTLDLGGGVLIPVSRRHATAVRESLLRSARIDGAPHERRAAVDPSRGRPRPSARRSPPPTRPVATEVDEQTALGQVYLRALIRSQLRLGWPRWRWWCCRCWGAGRRGDVAAVRSLQVGPLPLWWLLLGLLVYPAIFGVGWWYVRLAQRNEDRFAALLDEE